MIDTKERIRQKAEEQFKRYGIRSVSMDDLASQLGMSKKTLYQYFKDKDELVDAVIDQEILNMQLTCNCHRNEAPNAIAEMFMAMEHMNHIFRHMHPSILWDMQKYHHATWLKFQEHNHSFMTELIRTNLLRGIAEGWYRTDVHVDVLARFRMNSAFIVFNLDLFPPEQFNLAEVSAIIMEHFMYGVANEKGHQLIKEYQQAKSLNPAV